MIWQGLAMIWQGSGKVVWQALAMIWQDLASNQLARSGNDLAMIWQGPARVSQLWQCLAMISQGLAMIRNDLARYDNGLAMILAMIWRGSGNDLTRPSNDLAWR